MPYATYSERPIFVEGIVTNELYMLQVQNEVIIPVIQGAGDVDCTLF
jgi:hypothetical protein